MRLNQWSFRGQIINGPNVRVRKMTGPFGLPPVRGDDFLTMGRTGQQFVPKKHDSRRISLEIIVRDVPIGVTQGIFDNLALLFADRTQGPLANILDSGTRTGQAECVGWLPGDMSVGGLTHVGVADFQLADPWLYGPQVVSSRVTPNAGLTFGAAVESDISGPRTTWGVSLSGVVSGQPLILFHVTQGYTTQLSSIADTFATPYTWTRVDYNTGYADAEIWIGTGGVGTSGAVTVTAASGLIGGCVLPMVGASTAAGLSAIDAHGNASAAFPAWPSLSLIPTAAGEGAVALWLATYPSFYWLTRPGYITFSGIAYAADAALGLAGGWLNPTSGQSLALGPDGWAGSTSNGEMVGAIIKGSNVPVTLNVTNPGDVSAENMYFDIYGPIINPTVSNPVTGTSFTVTATIAASQHLIVNTGDYTAYVTYGGLAPSVANLIGSLAHSGADPFLTLAPGLNALQVSGAGCNGASYFQAFVMPPFL